MEDIIRRFIAQEIHSSLKITCGTARCCLYGLCRDLWESKEAARVGKLKEVHILSTPAGRSYLSLRDQQQIADRFHV